MKAGKSAAAFWSGRAASYDRRFAAMPAAYRDLLPRCRARLKPSDTLLDLGCGSGQAALSLAHAVRAVQACDLAPGMLAIASAHARDMGIANINFSLKDAAATGFSDASFDAALCLAVLHLMEHPELAMAELRRVLKPGGLLFLSAYLAGQSAVSRAGNTLMSLTGCRDEQKWAAEGFLRFVKDQGFAVLDSALYPMFPIPMRFLICQSR